MWPWTEASKSRIEEALIFGTSHSTLHGPVQFLLRTTAENYIQQKHTIKRGRRGAPRIDRSLSKETEETNKAHGEEYGEASILQGE